MMWRPIPYLSAARCPRPRPSSVTERTICPSRSSRRISMFAGLAVLDGVRHRLLRDAVEMRGRAVVMMRTGSTLAKRQFTRNKSCVFSASSRSVSLRPFRPHDERRKAMRKRARLPGDLAHMAGNVGELPWRAPSTCGRPFAREPRPATRMPTRRWQMPSCKSWPMRRRSFSLMCTPPARVARADAVSRAVRPRVAHARAGTRESPDLSRG